jgi:ABC-type transport system involved in multi-copper enzyme maturation permease subunit
MSSAVWATLVDTWRQSRQQGVYLLLASVLLLVSVGAVFLVKAYPASGGARVLWLRGQEHPTAGFEQQWDQTYRQALEGPRMAEVLTGPGRKAAEASAALGEANRRLARARLEARPEAEQKALERAAQEAQTRAENQTSEYRRLEEDINLHAQAEVDRRSPGISPLGKGVEVWLSEAAGLVFFLTMLGFIGASAGYFPGLMQAGAIDLVLAKPISRLELVMGKYLGGLGLCAVALFASELVMLVGLGLGTGVWSWGILRALPVTLFSAGLLYSVVMAIGVVTRSTALAMLGGYVYYLVVDTLIRLLQSLDALGLGVQSLGEVARVSRLAFPSFGQLRSAAAASVLNIPIFDWQPILVGMAWLLGLLAFGYAAFRRIDF